MSDALTDLLKRVRRIEIRSKRMSRQIFAGDYHSAFKGRGMTFAEVRPYQYGDDVRFIDWNVTARYQEPFIKTFEEERELSVIIMVDLSSSDSFGTRNMTKRELITELTAVIAISADTNNDKVGAIFFTDKIERFVPPRKGRSHILRIIRELLDFKSENSGTDIGNAFTFVTRAIKKKAIVFMISDFLDSRYEKALGMAARRHDVIGVHVSDRAEQELPDAGMVLIRDTESGAQQWVNTSSKETKLAYKTRFLEKADHFKTQFQKNNAGTLDICTDKPYLQELHNFFRNRK